MRVKFLASVVITYLSTLSADWVVPVTGDVGLAFDTFRSLPQGGWDGSTGALGRFNLALPIPYAWDGLGVQAGASYGVYDWSGHGSLLTGNLKEVQQDIFVTAGLFTVTPDCNGFNVGVAYDWMINKNFGVFGLSPDLAQVRAQIGYLLEGSEEYGLWGTVDAHTSQRHTEGMPVSFRAISQINTFWRHWFNNYAQTMLWVGLPYKKSLVAPAHRAGQFIFGASFRVPLNDCLSIDGHASYMRARPARHGTESRNYAANICVGITYSFGESLLPYLPIANNSNFIVDTSLNE